MFTKEIENGAILFDSKNAITTGMNVLPWTLHGIPTSGRRYVQPRRVVRLGFIEEWVSSFLQLLLIAQSVGYNQIRS